MNQLCLLYPFLTTALFHGGARAMLTAPLWRRYPPALDRFMNCPVCSGLWYGALVGLVGWVLGVPILGVTAWWTIVVVALASAVWTPMLVAVHERAILDVTGGPEPIDSGEPVPELHRVPGDGVTACIECGRPWVGRAIGEPVDRMWGKRCTDCHAAAKVAAEAVDANIA